MIPYDALITLLGWRPGQSTNHAWWRPIRPSDYDSEMDSASIWRGVIFANRLWANAARDAYESEITPGGKEQGPWPTPPSLAEFDRIVTEGKHDE